MIRSGCLRWGNDRRHLLLLLCVVTVSAGLRILLLLVLSLLWQLEFLLLLAVFLLTLHLTHLALLVTGFHVLQFAVRAEASIVFGAGDVLAVLEEGDSGDNESANECQAADVLGFVSG